MGGCQSQVCNFRDFWQCLRVHFGTAIGQGIHKIQAGFTQQQGEPHAHSKGKLKGGRIKVGGFLRSHLHQLGTSEMRSARLLIYSSGGSVCLGRGKQVKPERSSLTTSLTIVITQAKIHRLESW